jgi:hypothetical protein
VSQSDFFCAGSRVAKSSLFDRISIRRSINTTFLNAFSSANHSKSSTLVIRFDIAVPPSNPSEDIEDRQK